MVGASGPRMLELTARYADAWNADFGSSPESIRSLNHIVDAACREAGRDPATLERSASLMINVAGHARLAGARRPVQRDLALEVAHRALLMPPLRSPVRSAPRSFLAAMLAHWAMSRRSATAPRR